MTKNPSPLYTSIMRHWFRRFFTGNYNLLLIFLFLLFVFRPYDYHEIYVGIWKTFLTISLIVAIFNCSHRKAIKWAISILAVPTVILSWVNLFHQTTPIFIAVACLTAIFMLICAGSIIFDVVVKAQVTLETLRGVVCAYFLVSFIFAYIYLLLEYLHPGTFRFNAGDFPFYPHTRYFSEMLYFSFITLLTIGYGDISPLTEFGQTAVVIEGMIGQFYIAILVARIVAVYSFLSNKILIRAFEKDITKDPKQKGEPV